MTVDLAAEPRPSRAVTATLRLSVRVARADGTFSVRDDDPDPPVFGDLDLGLYGDAQGSKRERNSQRQRLISRPFSTRFG